MASPPETDTACSPNVCPFVRGIYWPPFCDDWGARLDAISNFEPREDDVFVLSYPKSGHHWSHEFLTRIMSGINDYPKGSLLG